MKVILVNKKASLLFFLILLFFIWQPVLAANFKQVSLDEIKDLEVGARVQVQGVVISEPGILGKQIFYLNGAQVYSYYKDFPKLKVGDEILVKGIISQSRGEKRIKIKTKEDIKILNQGLVISPQLVAINNITSQLVGYLIKIKGLVIEKTSPRIFIDPVKSDEVGISPEAKLFNGVDDDTGELVVYLKKYAPIDKSRIKEEDRVEITGVLSQSNDELRLLPRNNQDIQIIKNQNNYRDPEAIVDSLGQRQDFQILASGAKIDFNKFRPYLIISTIILGIIFIILLLIKKSS